MNNLFELKIPSLWMVVYNSFYKEETIIEDNIIVNNLAYKEDILSIEKVKIEDERYINDTSSYCIDLGWYPDSDPNGKYRLVVLKGDWNNIVEEYQSKSQQEIAELINQLLDKYQYD